MFQKNLHVSGSFTSAGTPAAVTVNLGFVPKYVKVWQEGASAGKYKIIEYTDAMGTDIAGVQLHDGSASATAAASIAAGSGIATYSGGSAASKAAPGFTVAAAAQTASKKMYWMASR